VEGEQVREVAAALVLLTVGCASSPAPEDGSQREGKKQVSFENLRGESFDRYEGLYGQAFRNPVGSIVHTNVWALDDRVLCLALTPRRQGRRWVEELGVVDLTVETRTFGKSFPLRAGTESFQLEGVDYRLTLTPDRYAEYKVRLEARGATLRSSVDSLRDIRGWTARKIGHSLGVVLCGGQQDVVVVLKGSEDTPLLVVPFQDLERGARVPIPGEDLELALDLPHNTLVAHPRARARLPIATAAAVAPRAALAGLALVITDRGSGSGSVVDSTGLVLTNRHVIEGAQRIEVALYGYEGQRFPARLKAVDPNYDLALLQLAGPPADLPILAFVDRFPPQGDPVRVVGSPGGVKRILEWSVSQGVISAYRKSPHAGEEFDQLQTDAAINPGNSGGPILSQDGRVVAVATSKIAGGGREGLGFGILANVAKRFVEANR
jgi:hypothetical protein